MVSACQFLFSNHEYGSICLISAILRGRSFENLPIYLSIPASVAVPLIVLFYDLLMSFCLSVRPSIAVKVVCVRPLT